MPNTDVQSILAAEQAGRPAGGGDVFQSEWLDACKGKSNNVTHGTSSKTHCDFDYSGTMIEQMLLGLVAHRVGKKIDLRPGHRTRDQCARSQRLSQAHIPLRLDVERLSRTGLLACPSNILLTWTGPEACLFTPGDRTMATPAPKQLPLNAYTPLPPGTVYQPPVAASEKLAELTPRSVGWGLFLCVIFTVASAYSGLKVGQVMEAAIPISILAIGLARVYPRRSTLLENVIITGIGGVAGSVVAGAIFTLPALYILKLDPHPVQTIFICLAGGCLGVLFLIPLRRYFVREMHGQLPYPEATAITEVLVTGEKGGSQAKLLLQATAIAGVYDFLVTTFHVWKEYLDFQFVPVVRDAHRHAPAWP